VPKYVLTFVLASALAAVAMLAGIRSQPVSVHIRWAAAVSDSGRIAAEQRFGLAQGTPHEGTTWRYLLTDHSTGNISALVSDARVEDTDNLDRRAFRPIEVPWSMKWIVFQSVAFGVAATLGLAFIQGVGQGRLPGRVALAGAHPASAGAQWAVVTLVTLLFGAVFFAFLVGQQGHRINDFTAHIEYAATIGSAADIRSPHFVFQLLINAVHAVGLSYVISTVVVMAVSYGGMALLLVREIRRRDAETSVRQLLVLVPSLLIASHIFLLTVADRNLYWGYFVPVMYTNPTQQLNKLFALWIYLWYAARVLESPEPRVRDVPALGALCILSALAKPSFLIAFLPAAGLYGLRDLARRRWRHVSVLAGGVVLPSVAVLLWQARVANEGGGFAVHFAPFTLFDGWSTLYKLPLSLAFPIAVAFVARGVPAVKDRLGLLWLFVGFAMFYTLALVESGSRLPEGNFAWSAQTAVFLAYIESALCLLTLRADARLRLTAWMVLGVHVTCGAFWYASNFLPEQDRWL
jgi:hypothetical protein